MRKIILNMKIRKWALDVYQKVSLKRDAWLKRPARLLIGWGVTANALSFSRLLLVIPMFVLVGISPISVLLILFVNYYILDAIDGVVARESGKCNVKGRTIDLSIDHFYVIPLVLALIYFNVADGFLSALYLVNLLIDYFVKYLRFGIEIGKYPFTFSKYIVYIVFFIWSVTLINIFDYSFLFLAIYLLITNIVSITKLYNGN